MRAARSIIWPVIAWTVGAWALSALLGTLMWAGSRGPWLDDFGRGALITATLMSAIGLFAFDPGGAIPVAAWLARFSGALRRGARESGEGITLLGIALVVAPPLFVAGFAAL